MNSLNEDLKQLKIPNTRIENKYTKHGNVAPLVGNLQQKIGVVENASLIGSKTAPSIPPKPLKKSIETPEVPLSKLVKDTQEPLFSQPLLGASNIIRRQSLSAEQRIQKPSSRGSTLDNPAILEQQLEALAYHKQRMERKGLLRPQAQEECSEYIPKVSCTSLCIQNPPKHIACLYSNLPASFENIDSKHVTGQSNPEHVQPVGLQNDEKISCVLEPKVSLSKMLSVWTNPSIDKDQEEDFPPTSPVSSSYSELRRASDLFNKDINVDFQDKNPVKESGTPLPHGSYVSSHYESKNIYQKDFHIKTSAEYFGYGQLSQNSSTYDSIYEPINPRPAKEQVTQKTDCNAYPTYVNHCQMPVNLSHTSNVSLANTSTLPKYYNEEAQVQGYPNCSVFPQKKHENYENISQYNLSSIDSANDIESYGRCYKCSERVLGESSGCTAMDQIYHISCFTCTECQINLQGKPFYALEGQPFCEYDYLQTLEKCSVCFKPILERILRATGKPYHPKCFTCVVCRKSLDAIPFTVDATNQNYCIADFHKKFAPRCCVCQDPIMPEAGQEETVRVVALDRSFHLECYKCEDCGLLLSSEADGRGCYPLDDHVLCKSCNARRVQALTNRMNSEL